MKYSPEQFEQLVKEFMDQEAHILNWKSQEYTAGADRLQNFRQVAEFLSLRPTEVAFYYLMKHIQSIQLAVESGKYAWAWNTDGGEGMKQRICDARNYLLLLAAAMDEESESHEF